MTKFSVLMATLLWAGLSTAASLPSEVISGTVGEVRIQGVLLSSTCHLRMETVTQSVNLGEVSAGVFKQAGDRTSKVPFQLQFSGCLIGASTAEPPPKRIQVLAAQAHGANTDQYLNGQHAVVMTLVGEPDANNSKLLKVSGDTAGIGVHFSDELGRTLNINEQNRAYVLAPGQNTLTFFADIESTQTAVRAGAFNAVVNVRLSYL